MLGETRLSEIFLGPINPDKEGQEKLAVDLSSRENTAFESNC